MTHLIKNKMRNNTIMSKKQIATTSANKTGQNHSSTWTTIPKRVFYELGIEKIDKINWFVKDNKIIIEPITKEEE